MGKLQGGLEALKGVLTPKAGFANPNWWYGVHDGLGQNVNDIMQGRGYGSEQGREGARTIGNEGFRVDMGRVQLQVPGGDKQQTESQGWGQFETNQPPLPIPNGAKRQKFTSFADGLPVDFQSKSTPRTPSAKFTDKDIKPERFLAPNSSATKQGGSVNSNAEGIAKDQ